MLEYYSHTTQEEGDDKIGEFQREIFFFPKISPDKFTDYFFCRKIPISHNITLSSTITVLIDIFSYCVDYKRRTILQNPQFIPE
jgi:hypothetical protein